MDYCCERTKDPNAVLDYGFDWTAWLDGDTISASSWAVSTGITKDSDSKTTTTTTIWLSGGTNGRNYEATNSIQTAAGRKTDRTMLIKVREQ